MEIGEAVIRERRCNVRDTRPRHVSSFDVRKVSTCVCATFLMFYFIFIIFFFYEIEILWKLE